MSWDEDFKINFYSRLRAWKDEHLKNPRFIKVDIDEPLRSGGKISIRIVPYPDLADQQNQISELYDRLFTAKGKKENCSVRVDRDQLEFSDNQLLAELRGAPDSYTFVKLCGIATLVQGTQ